MIDSAAEGSRRSEGAALRKKRSHGSSQKRGKRPKGLLLTAICAVVGLVLAGILLAPKIHSAYSTEKADGATTFELPGLGSPPLTVRPDEGWLVRPSYTGSVLTLLTPDQKLTIELESIKESEAAKLLSSTDAPQKSELLANGVSINHVTAEPYFTGVIDLTSLGKIEMLLLVRAEATANTDIQRYLTAIGNMLETIQNVQMESNDATQ